MVIGSISDTLPRDSQPAWSEAWIAVKIFLLRSYQWPVYRFPWGVYPFYNGRNYNSRKWHDFLRFRLVIIPHDSTVVNMSSIDRVGRYLSITWCSG